MTASQLRKFRLRVSPIASRNELGDFLNRRHLVGGGVEIGTHRGDFAAKLLETWEGKMLYCVDPWCMGYDDMDPVSRQSYRGDDYRQALLSLRPYCNPPTRVGASTRRCTIIQAYSHEAICRFENESLDLVYIDGCHTYEGVFRDLTLWWPKLRLGGMLAGHDILLSDEHQDRIQAALFDFVDHLGSSSREPVNRKEDPTSIYLIPETQQPWSYYLFRV